MGAAISIHHTTTRLPVIQTAPQKTTPRHIHPRAPARIEATPSNRRYKKLQPATTSATHTPARPCKSNPLANREQIPSELLSHHPPKVVKQNNAERSPKTAPAFTSSLRSQPC